MLYATDKQIAFLRRLAAERGVTVNTVNLSRSRASAEIERLMAMPRTATPAARPVTPEVGTYVLQDGTIVRIVWNQEKTRRYGKRWTGTAWEYVSGLGSRVAGLRPITLAEAEAFGVATGQCAICGRTLTKKESVRRGIGPICAGRL